MTAGGVKESGDWWNVNDGGKQVSNSYCGNCKNVCSWNISITQCDFELVAGKFRNLSDTKSLTKRWSIFLSRPMVTDWSFFRILSLRSSQWTDDARDHQKVHRTDKPQTGIYELSVKQIENRYLIGMNRKRLSEERTLGWRVENNITSAGGRGTAVSIRQPQKITIVKIHRWCYTCLEVTIHNGWLRWIQSWRPIARLLRTCGLYVDMEWFVMQSS